MENFDFDLYKGREEMLKLLNGTSLDEISGIISSVILSSFIMIPRERRMFFTDGMKDFLGPMVKQDVLLTSYLQLVPDDERTSIEIQFEDAVKDLVLMNGDIITIEHSLRKGNFDICKVAVHMQAVMIEKKVYIVGIVNDITPSIRERAMSQLISNGIDAYIFAYDIAYDICYCNERIVEAFDLMSYKVMNASREFRRYIHPDDSERFFAGVRAFISQQSNTLTGDYKFLSSSRGEIHLRALGMSDASYDGNPNGDPQLVTGCFTDITSFIEDESIRNNLIEGSSAITFYADMKHEKVVFSENIHEILPDVNTEVSGAVVETVSEHINPDDRKRFKDMMHQITDGQLEKFSIEFRVMDDSNRRIWIACRGKSFYDSSKQGLVVVGTVFDLTRMNEVREGVERNASCDELTGLPTRERLISDAEEIFRNKDLLSASVILIDINGFHSYNDRYGRSTGNEILIALAEVLQKRLPEGCKIYHIDVDIFCILWPHASRVRVTEYMNYLQEESNQPLEVGRGSFFITYALAASIYPSCGSNVEELLDNAEIALHKVKQDKKLKYSIYSPMDKRELKEKIDFEHQISQSIRNTMDSFQLYYQPLVDAKTERVVGAEALLRWIAPNGELVNPERVVSALESTDQMETIGAWIMERAMNQCANWLKNGADPNFYVHINCTADDVVRKDFVNDVLVLLARYNLSPRNILLEITETSLMKNIAVCRQNLIRLRSENIRIALDDFGTGYSSFNYLRELPVDEIKIDKAFVDDMDTIAFNRSFISAITMLAHSIKKQVCVEGIESESQSKSIRDMGADVLQGYYYSKPLTVFNFENKFFK